MLDQMLIKYNKNVIGNIYIWRELYNILRVVNDDEMRFLLLKRDVKTFNYGYLLLGVS